MSSENAKIIVLLGVLTSIIFFIYGLIDQTNMLFYSVLIIWCINILYSSLKMSERISFMLFNICIFTFLIGKNLVLMIRTGEWMIMYSNDEYRHLCICLYIVLISILTGYNFTKKNKQKNMDYCKKIESRLVQQKYFKIMMCFVIPVYMYYLMQQILFVRSYGYNESYTAFQYSNLLIYSVSNQLFYISFFGFLITLPTKRDAITPIVIFCFISVLNLFTGQRNTTILNLMIILWYYIKRNFMNKEEKWLGNFEKIAIIISIPIIISGAYLYSIVREGGNIGNISFFKSIIGFFEQLGDSNRVIIYSKVLKSDFPSPHWRYFFSPIIDLFKENRIAVALGLSENLKRYTVEFAFKGYSFGSTLSYILLGQGYLNGAGVGSSFIAEAYLSFGYLGAGCYSVFLGFMLKKIEYLLDRTWLLSIIGLLWFKTILISPREVALEWFVTGINLTTFLGIFPLYIFMRKRNKVKNNN